MTDSDPGKSLRWREQQEAAGQFLRHYTTPAGLIGIIESGALWATDARFLNDFREMVEGLQVIQIMVEEARSKFGGEPLARLAYRLQSEGNSREVYVCSFSTEKDDLSQWRAYSAGRVGICLTFHRPHLERLGSAQGFEITRCAYDLRENLEVGRKEVEQTLLRLRMAEQSGPAAVKEEVDHAFHHLVGLAAGMKHAAFNAEREWRAICVEQDSQPDVRFRSSTALGVVPYVALNLVEEDKTKWGRSPGGPLHGRYGITEITLYPQRVDEVQFSAVSALARKYRIGAAVDRSTCPHRT